MGSGENALGIFLNNKGKISLYKFKIKKSASGLDRVVILPDAKPNYSKFFVEIDLTKWLGSEDISAVTFTAKTFGTKQVVTTTVIDTTKCTNSTKVLKPFIQAGTDDETYLVTMQVTTNGSPASLEEFYLKFTINDNIPGM